MAKRKRSKAAENAKRRAAEHKRAGGSSVLRMPSNMEMFEVKKGKYLVDILNYKVGKGNPWADKGDMHYERTYYVHKGIGVQNKWYVCPRMTADQRCPICEYRAKLMKGKSDSEETKDLIRSLKAQERQLFNVIDVTKGANTKVLLWDVPFNNFGAQLDGEIGDCDDDEDYGEFGDAKNGFTLRLGVDDETFGSNTYQKVNRISFKNRKKAYDDKILEELMCLDDILIIPSYDDI